MTAPSYDDVYQYATLVQRVSQEAKEQFRLSVDNIDFDDWSQAADDLRTVVYSIVDEYGLASSELGAQWYEYCKELADGRVSTAIVGQTSRYSVESDVNAVIDKLFNGEIDIEELINQLSGVVVDQTQKQARDAILTNLDADIKAAFDNGDYSKADSMGYARVTVGDSCAFCVMLASRGFVYRSKKTALRSQWGNKYHPNCNCVAVPFHEAHTIPGYGDKLAEYDRMYRDADNLRRSGDVPEELQKSIDAAKAEHMARYKAGETNEPWRSFNEITMIMRYQNEGLK